MKNTTTLTRKPSEPAGQPLRPRVLKSQADYDAAMARINQIFDAVPGTEPGDELELLLLLVEKYEDDVFPMDLPDPIAAIRFRMDQQKLKPKDLVPYLGNKSKVSEVLSGQRPLSLAMIRNLVSKLGIPAEVLLREPGAKLEASEILDFGKHLPLSEMLKRGWFSGFTGTLHDLKDQLEDVLVKFAAPVGSSWQCPALNRQRVRNGGTADHAALTAWRIRVVSQALRETLPTYRPGTVTPMFLSDVVRLSYLADGPRLAKEYLSKNGIHLVTERHLPRTFLDGAAMKLPDDTRLVALTLRHDRLDNFWFTLSHELAHVGLHLDHSDVDVIFDDLDAESSEAWEREADEMAAEALIPAREWKEFKQSHGKSADQVKAFAERLRVHPAIPAGRIRFEKHNYHLLNDLVGRGQVRRQLEIDSR